MMRLRFVEDRRTLLWAFVLFPLSPLLALWRPQLLPWLAPLLLYCSYLSGVLTHNHTHSPVFRGRHANLLYGAWLSIFYGFPIVSWLPTHNQNHHRYTNGDGDATATTRHASQDSLLAALSYPLASSRFQLPLLRQFVAQSFRMRSSYRVRILVEGAVLLLAHAATLWLFVHVHGARVGAWGYWFAMALPALLGTYWMMLTNYLQHVGCRAGSVDEHSRNFVSPLMNWFVFDNGYHTVHHEQPGLHWSRYRALHEARAAHLGADLNAGTLLGYAAQRYLTVPQDNARARHFIWRACSLKDQVSCHSYAKMLATGSFGPRDARQALELFTRSCKAGYAPSCAEASRLRPPRR